MSPDVPSPFNVNLCKKLGFPKVVTKLLIDGTAFDLSETVSILYCII
jgi:hypothetical protein